MAHPVLAAAWTQLRQLRAIVAGHIGRLALPAGDLVIAQAGYLDAYAERPEKSPTAPGLADILVKLGRAEEAVVLLRWPDPRRPRISSAAQAPPGPRPGGPGARGADARLWPPMPPRPNTLAAAAHLQADAG